MIKLLLLILFTYANDDRGLRLAYGEDADSLQSIGGTIVSSDYGQWGVGKRMYNPFLTKENGLWNLTFKLDDKSPAYGTTSSPDLLHWKPQDYPRGRQVFDESEFKMATVDGKKQKGQIWQVNSDFIQHLKQHFDSIANLQKLWSENFDNDKERFKNLKEVNATLTISNKSKKISDKLMGIFFEDISYAADGGLYAELIQNRDFEYSQADRPGDRKWNSLTGWNNVGRVSADYPLSKNNPNYITLQNDTLINYGWDGICLDKNAKYNLSLFARTEKKQTLNVELVENGIVLASAKIKLKGKGWQEYKTTLTSAANADKAELHLYTDKGKEEICLDIISLFPQDTYKGHGMRKDLAQAIADLQPKFMRFPGGCMTHGDGIDNIYRWKESIGDWKDRKGAPNIWRYHQTRGLGFYEYFQFCEDIGAEPLPVLSAGVPCQNSSANSEGYGGQQGGIPMELMPEYVQDILDLIEWANADAATSHWANMRAEAGHPAPFNLKYIGIGNEDLISDVFTERYLMICKAIKEKYPDIIVCGTVGPFHKGSSDYEWGWKIAKENANIIDMVDEHYYESPGWFMHNQDYYDNYDRNAPKVYLGEYASHPRNRGNQLEASLTEALHLCNVERNGDVVMMTSYAPLLSKDGHSNWNPDLIYFNNREVRTTKSYKVQKDFSTMSGDEYIYSSLDLVGEFVEPFNIPSADFKHRIATSIVRNSQTGQTYLRIVNALPVKLNIQIGGKTLTVNKYSYIVEAI